MTSKRLATVTAAAAALLLTVPSLATAALPALGRHRVIVPRVPRHRAIGPCKLSLLAEPHRVTSGDETPQLFGRLSCGAGAETAGQTVTIYQRIGLHAPLAIGTTTTTTDGYYSYVAAAPAASGSYYAVADSVRSPARLVRVAPQVTLSGPTETKALFTGVANRVSFSGTVDPGAAGALVVLQREAATANEEWLTIQRGVVRAGGTFDLVHVFAVPGDANIRAVVRPFGYDMVYGASTSLSYVITQRENPLLTLSATSAATSSDPIFYGQPVTLGGTVAGGAGKPVTLLARTAHSLFSPLASMTAGANGQYSFQQAPQQNTFYRVRAADGTTSAVLFEGVKFVLSAASSATSLPAGQTLTFSGTVTPYQAGHIVYLERQNASGTGWHVVAVSTLTAPVAPSTAASYSIGWTVFGSGKQVYRVKVPGDPVNLGAASEPFSVEVTPAPAAALRPGQQVMPPKEGSV